MNHDPGDNAGVLPGLTPAEEGDALLTAYALDRVGSEGGSADAASGLGAAECVAVERRLADPAAAADRAHVADVRRIAAALRADRGADLPERSVDLRRAVLAAAAAGPVAEAARDGVSDTRPAATPEAGAGSRLAGALAGLAAIAVAVVVFVRLPAGDARRRDREVAQVAAGTAGGGADQDADESARSLAADPAAPGPAAAPVAGRPAPVAGRPAPVAGRPAPVAGRPAPVAGRPAPVAADGRAKQGAAPLAAGKPAETAPGLPAPAAGSAPTAGVAAEQRRTAMPAQGRVPAPEAMPQPWAVELFDAGPPDAPAGPRQPGAKGDEKWFSERERAPAGDANGRAAADPAALAASAPLPRLLSDKSFAKESDREVATRDVGPGDEAARRVGSGTADGERYAAINENAFLSPADAPLSTFSIDVDTASYANVRRFLAGGRLPPRDAVRIEELVNYFRYDLPQPAGADPFSVTVDAAGCPWAPAHRLVRVALQGRSVDRGARPAGNIVFLIDVSGSMRDADKLPLVKQALVMLVEELGEDDRVSIVTYAGEAGLVLPPTGGEQKQRIRAAIERLSPGGSTHGSAGIELAYEQAAAGFVTGGVNRVILATDGDLNVGVTSDEALVELIKRKAAGGTFLTVLGVGTGNLQDAKMEKLADNGNGVYAYLDGIREARKVLVEQLAGSTIAIAKDVKIQVEFNPARVASYRLIGYENRVMAAADFRDDRKDAGEIGAGHAVTALYEIVPAGVAGGPRGGPEPLKYQPRPEPVAAVPAADASPELLTVKLRSKRPDADTSTLQEVPFTDAGAAFDRAPADFRFAAAVASFGMLLRGSRHAGTATLSEAAVIAGGALGPDAGGYRAEFLDLVRKAQALGGHPRD